MSPLPNLSVAYQPVVARGARQGEGQILYFEALARNPGRSTGPSRHETLIAVGEEFGFVHEIDITILRLVAARMRAQPELTVAINVSVVTLQHHLGEWVGAIYTHRDIAHRLVFEITETVAIVDAASIRLFLQTARLLGGRIAFDDYGAGHFTAAQITDLQPDFVKLSGKLVQQLALFHPDVHEIREITGAYGGQLIAEHVDSEEKCEALLKLGVPYMQGYLFGKPGAEPHLPYHLVASSL